MSDKRFHLSNAVSVSEIQKSRLLTLFCTACGKQNNEDLNNMLNQFPHLTLHTARVLYLHLLRALVSVLR